MGKEGGQDWLEPDQDRNDYVDMTKILICLEEFHDAFCFTDMGQLHFNDHSLHIQFVTDLLAFIIVCRTTDSSVVFAGLLGLF